MNTTTHTPGPWKLSASGGLVVPDNGNPVAVICKGFDKYGDDFPNWSQNAHLIAAAPDLLENLEHALTFIELFGDHRHLEKGKCAHCRLIQHMQQAINKAKGITSQTQDQPEPEPSDGDLLLDQMHADAPSPYDP